MEAAIDLCSEIVSAVMSDESNKSLVAEAKPDTVHSASTPGQVTAILNSLAQSQGASDHNQRCASTDSLSRWCRRYIKGPTEGHSIRNKVTTWTE